MLQNTVKCYYNVIQYNTIFHTALGWLKQNINQRQITNYIPYLALTGELWGVICEDSVENWPHFNGTALYMTFKYEYLHEPDPNSDILQVTTEV